MNCWEYNSVEGEEEGFLFLTAPHKTCVEPQTSLKLRLIYLLLYLICETGHFLIRFQGFYAFKEILREFAIREREHSGIRSRWGKASHGDYMPEAELK